MLESAEIVVALILMAVCWFAWYLARDVFNLENRQIVELAWLLEPNRAQPRWLIYPHYYYIITTARSTREKR